MYKVEFDLYREPTNLKQIARWPFGFGIILILLTVLVLYPGKYLPLELYFFYLVEIVGEFTLHLISLGIIFITTGLILDYLSWRTGKLIIKNDRLQIKGSKEFYLKYENITRVKFLQRKTIQIRTRYYPVRLKFKNQKDLQDVYSTLEKQTENVMQLNVP